MIKLVISGGDSFTFGAELTAWPAAYNTPSPGSWAQLVANKLNANLYKHVNTARSGRSNSFIVRHVINTVHQALKHEYKREEIFVQVMWTFVARQEIAVNCDTQRSDSPWFPIDPYVCEDESKGDWFKKVLKDTKNWKESHDAMHERYLINKDLGLVDYAKAYYRIVSDLHDTYTSLSEILSLQELLDYNNIRYMFTYVNKHVMNGLIHPSGRDQSWDRIYPINISWTEKFTDSLCNFIKFDEWYKFPIDGKYVGFDDWAKFNKYEYATSHPLEKAHADAAELIYDHISNIRW